MDRISQTRLVVPAIIVGLTLLLAIWALTASRGIVPGDAVDSVNVTAVSAQAALVAAAVSAVPLAVAWRSSVLTARVSAVLPILATLWQSFYALLFWFSGPPCPAGGFAQAILCVHPYWILVPAVLSSQLSVAAVLLPVSWVPWRVNASAVGGLLMIFGAVQIFLRHEHGSLGAGLLLTAIGLGAIGIAVWVTRSLEVN